MRIFDRLLTYLYITFLGFSGIMARPIGCKSIISTCNTNSIGIIISSSQYYELLCTWMKFQGFAVWLYEPPQSELFVLSIPADHTMCFHEGNSASNVIFCTRTNITEAYPAHNNSKAPVEFFLKSSLQTWEHQIRAFIIITTDKLDSSHRSRLSCCTYTTEWSASSHSNLTPLFASKSPHTPVLCTIKPSVPYNPGQRIFWNLQVYRRPPVYGGFPISRPPPPSSFVIWVQALLVFWIALGFSLKCIEVAPEHREQRRLLHHAHRYRDYNGNPERARNDSTRTAPPSYTRPPSYYVPENEAGVLRDDMLGGSNGPPPYTDIIREQSQVQ